MKTPRALFLIPAAAAGALLAAAACGPGPTEGHSEAGHSAQDAPSARARVASVRRVPSENAFTAPGEIASGLSSTLTARVMGRVESVLVREGDAVREGQVLARIDLREVESSIEMARAGVNSAQAGSERARSAQRLEAEVSRARIGQAQSQVELAQAALREAKSRRDLVYAGPRDQEVAQADIAVLQAESSLRLAEAEVQRARTLYGQGAIAKRELDMAENRFDLAKGQHEIALKSREIARDGARRQERDAADQAVQQAEAALKQAESGLAEARAAQRQVDLREKEVRVAQSQVNEARASLNSAQATASYGVIRAPFAGRVTKRHVDPGALAGPGQPILTIDGGGLRLEARLPESVMVALSLGDTAPIEVEALDGARLQGTVIEMVPKGDPGARTFLTRFSLPAEPGLTAGMFGRVRIPTGSALRILIPEDAFWTRDGVDYVMIVNSDDIARLRVVTLGRIAEGRVEVLTGLAEGERIIVGDRSGIQDGTRIEAE